MTNIVECLSKELNKAQDIIRTIASMGHDSTDKEIAEEVRKITRQYVNWEIITPKQIKIACAHHSEKVVVRPTDWVCPSCCMGFDTMPTDCPVSSPGCNELLIQCK